MCLAVNDVAFVHGPPGTGDDNDCGVHTTMREFEIESFGVCTIKRRSRQHCRTSRVQHKEEKEENTNGPTRHPARLVPQVLENPSKLYFERHSNL